MGCTLSIDAIAQLACVDSAYYAEVPVPDAFLELVFSQLDMTARCQVLPLVCKQWNRVLAGPSIAWRLVDLGSTPLAHRLSVSAATVYDTRAAWLQGRAGCVEALTYSPSAARPPLDAKHFHQAIVLLQPSITQMQLSQVKLDLLPAICACTKLTHLQLSLSGWVETVGHLRQHLDQLTNLRSLQELHLVTEVRVSWSLTWEEEAERQQQQGGIEDPNWPLPDNMVSLPNLRKLHISCFTEPSKVTPDMAAGGA